MYSTGDLVTALSRNKVNRLASRCMDGLVNVRMARATRECESDNDVSMLLL